MTENAMVATASTVIFMSAALLCTCVSIDIDTESE